MLVDDAFEREEMAALYDSFNTHGEDRIFYLRLVKEPCRILDIGCGTGLLTLPLSQLGHDVTGVDPAPGMLSIARAKDIAHEVHWIQAGASDFTLDKHFDLAIMTAHVFQVFLNDADTLAVLSNIRRHMSPNGRLVFESRNPAFEHWRNWTQDQTREVRDVEGVGPVEVYYQWHEIDGDLLSFETVFTLLKSGEKLTSKSTLRFPTLPRIQGLLEKAGFKIERTSGWWDRSAFQEQASPEIIVEARTV